jgi:hypothetical protein
LKVELLHGIGAHGCESGSRAAARYSRPENQP